ncbi:class I SAM-dependent methyltransferase [Alphaproteobacteria bacterium]|nr:class I SAM-dependent methyltransferase [Alphaproteobacteria bacterium]MDA8725964.1 class I SAM-dependent methyltransferase [Alphaproteobacteria bacterium]
MANERQADFWSGPGGQSWVDNQTQMDTMLQPLGDAALELLNLKNAKHVMDIGCGTGTTTINIAQKLSAGGSVTGADLSEPMIEFARQRLLDEGISDVEFVACDLQEDELQPEIYDAAFSRFGVMFFDQSVKGFANIRSAMKPNSPIAFVCWQSSSHNLWHSAAMAVAKEFIEMPAVQDPRAPGPFAFADPDYVNSILVDAEFKRVSLTPHEQEVELFSGQTVRAAAENFARINPVIGSYISSVDVSAAATFFDALADTLSSYHKDNALRFPSATWLVTATA